MGISKKEPKVRYPMDYSKLKGRIVEKFGKQAAFADEIGYSEKSVSDWLNNQTPWPHEAMVLAVDALDILGTEVGAYFFTRQVIVS